MKEIKAYVREDMLGAFSRALRTAGARAVTAVRAVPLGSDIDPAFVDISSAVPNRALLANGETRAGVCRCGRGEVRASDRRNRSDRTSR